MEDVDVATIANMLSYDPETGKLFWKVNTRRTKAGQEAGCCNGDGHLKVGIIGRKLFAHRIAYALMTGAFPSAQIDHINGNRMDNRWCNLRPVDIQENAKNRSVNSNSKSGIIGVRWRQDRNKWSARIYLKGKEIHLGDFEMLLEAACVRKSAEAVYGFHENHGRAND